MDEKTLATLEFDKILARLAALTSFSAGRELALALRPSTDHGEVIRRQRITAEARRFREISARRGLGGVRDVRPLANKANLGGVLEPAELLNVAATLSAAHDLRDTLTRLSAPLPLLAETAERIADLAEVAADIYRCISPRAEVVDSASPMLAVLRRDLRTVHDRLYARLQELINSAEMRPVIQEPIITLRDGRYVIPVKAEMRGHVQGIVHDVSASGATVFMEPLSVVELGNTWRETELEEQREVERILRRLSSLVGRHAHAIGLSVEALAEIDLALAKARLAEELGAFELPYDGERQPWITEAPSPLNLVNARHPLLAGDVVPISLSVGGNYSVLLVTGPNTGGKTVALKTVGLLTAMAQAGLPVPADAGSRIPVFASLHADIGDEQSIEQSLSTFSSHMTNIIAALKNAGPNSLVLLDELGAGTDPGEGAALARALLEHLLRVGCLTIATTHHGELKVFAHGTEGIMNASVEFDVETLAPTYRISIGLPGSSNALAIAERLGLPADIVERARESIDPDQARAESLLAAIQREKAEAADARRAEMLARKEAEEIRRGLEEKLDAIDREREQIIAAARAQAEEELARIRQLIAHAGRRIERAKPEAAAEKVAAAEARLETLKPPPAPKRRRRGSDTVPPEEIQPGDLVWVRGLGRFGEALSTPDAKGEVKIRLGALRSSVSLKKVEKVQRVKAHGPTLGGTAVPPPPATVASEIELRGRLVDEALPDLDKYLDDAFRAGLPWVRIIHGRGTGTLARAVRHALSLHPLVRSHEPAPREEGGDGVTIAHLAT